jgi:hypothetical protein
LNSDRLSWNRGTQFEDHRTHGTHGKEGHASATMGKKRRGKKMRSNASLLHFFAPHLFANFYRLREFAFALLDHGTHRTHRKKDL